MQTGLNLNLTSLKVVKLTAYAETGLVLGVASGFFVEYKDRTFLVTCWHVASGRNLHSRKPTHSSLATPAALKVDFWVNRFLDSERRKFEAKGYTTPFLIPVAEGSVDLEKFCHPTFGSRIDVVAFDVTEIRNAIIKETEYDIVAFDLDEMCEGASVNVMDHVFIPGYPEIKSPKPNDLPIYKSGFIASEPHYFSEIPFVMVDGKTKSGWSGSPIIHSLPLSIGDVTKGEFLKGQKRRLYAVYSGRDESDPEATKAELAYAWPIENCLLPILQNECHRLSSSIATRSNP